mmetsp:Transcript_11482/g.19424  ORF Transcript_11482/g.19424 Transcript_11482/m.19424 type:complete len:213 (-) Transcript_11482:116-754(-)
MEYVHYPVQVGKGIGTRGQKAWMSGLVFLQAALTVLRLVYLFEALGGFFMGLDVYLGWYALKKSLDITAVSLWGLISALLLVYDGLGALTGIMVQTFHLQFLKVGVLLALPVVHFLAADFAWELFKEHERTGGLFKPFFADAKTIEQQKLQQQHYAAYGTEGMKTAPQMSAVYSSHGAPEKPQMSPFHTGYYPQEMHNPADTASRKQHSACC